MGDMADWQIEQMFIPTQDGDFTEDEMRCASECANFISLREWCKYNELDYDIGRCPHFKAIGREKGEA